MGSGSPNESEYMDEETLNHLKEEIEPWSWEQNKAFENALATLSEDDDEDRWGKIADCVPGKSVEDVERHYQVLEEDVSAIDGGRVPLPSYLDEEVAVGKKGADGKAPRARQERRRGIPWSDEEHRLFLLGLEKFGRSDWRSISREYVVTKTPGQVASHAQKYFIRLESGTKDKRRSSIHDITTVNDRENQGPITGQKIVPAPVPGMPGKQPDLPPARNPRISSGPVNRSVSPNSVPPVSNMVVPGSGARENWIENVNPENHYPEYQMENAYPENQMENAYPENQTKNTYLKSP